MEYPSAVKFLGLTKDEIIERLEKHLERCTSWEDVPIKDILAVLKADQKNSASVV